MTKLPPTPVIVVRDTPRSSIVAVTMTPGRPSPLASRTWPRMSPVVWAATAPANAAMEKGCPAGLDWTSCVWASGISFWGLCPHFRKRTPILTASPGSLLRGSPDQNGKMSGTIHTITASSTTVSGVPTRR